MGKSGPGNTNNSSSSSQQRPAAAAAAAAAAATAITTTTTTLATTRLQVHVPHMTRFVRRTGRKQQQQQQQSPQQRVMKLGGSDLSLMLYGAHLGTEAADGGERNESERQQRWDQVPRELKAAVRRLHENLGHATTTEMLRALRISRASTDAVRHAASSFATIASELRGRG